MQKCPLKEFAHNTTGRPEWRVKSNVSQNNTFIAQTYPPRIDKAKTRDNYVRCLVNSELVSVPRKGSTYGLMNLSQKYVGYYDKPENNLHQRRLAKRAAPHLGIHHL